MSLGIFIFRRDLRVIDNNGLNQICRECEKVMPIFIFDPRQVGRNDFKSLRSIKFMLRALRGLSDQLEAMGAKLSIFFGEPGMVVGGLCRKLKPAKVGFNMDYTPYAKERDKGLREIIKGCGAEALIAEDVGLWSAEEAKNVYEKYTPYTRSVAKRRVVVGPKVSKVEMVWAKGLPHQTTLSDMEAKLHSDLECNSREYEGADRERALARLRGMSKLTAASYEKRRNDLSYETSNLSAAFHFGVISVREAWKITPCLRREILWREFFMNITNTYDISKRSLKPNYDKVRWRNDEEAFARWKEGRTGYPLVDACMRCLNATGFLHNRGRLIVGSFLVKTLGISWRLGEKYFAQTLIDYDWSNNYHGWLWISGGGADSQPYFRIFNPWRQQLRFDKDFVFVKKWLPEVRRIPVEVLKKWEDVSTAYLAKYRGEDKELAKYPPPMVDFHEQSKKVLKMYKRVFSK
ncbi:Deoxyribodipyrimidine photolyase [Kaumoebavirus]|uniref:Deoxyribodipyrimidine photolyase n=1 Tax=Kaumoebavirus TaxID=1859492 RepID=UPI0009C26CD2|nr:Deoxyribodipyrimidine photolyase [Kaumoebavirus]ARA72237.1 Deoxyribodipyrimidine photolyase [Kaumoebavirus]